VTANFGNLFGHSRVVRFYSDGCAQIPQESVGFMWTDIFSDYVRPSWVYTILVARTFRSAG
jgi:hypothetical protein